MQINCREVLDYNHQCFLCGSSCSTMEECTPYDQEVGALVFISISVSGFKSCLAFFFSISFYLSEVCPQRDHLMGQLIFSSIYA